MKLIIGTRWDDRSGIEHFLTTTTNGPTAWCDDEIIRNLQIPPHEFYSILYTYNGIYNYKLKVYIFRYTEDLEKVIGELEPFLIMEELLK